MPTALPAPVYESLRALAAKFLADERASHTLQPTALAHEAYLRLAGMEGLESQERYMAMAAVALRHILVDHARRRNAAKRGADGRVMMDLTSVATRQSGVDILDFEQALERLNERGEREATVVVLRVYGGLTLEQAAGAVGVSLRTAASDWAIACAFLRRELSAYSEGATC
jgi:RNA polymerase sigma-70 factor (ECF subfamily)